MRPYVVLDTNTLVSMVLRPRGVMAQGFKIASEQFIMVTTEETANELIDVMARPKFDAYQPIAARLAFVDLYLQAAEHIPLSKLKVIDTSACPDPDDMKFLQLAVSLPARALVTGDAKHLLPLNPFQGIPIVNMRQFVDTWQVLVP